MEPGWTDNLARKENRNLKLSARESVMTNVTLNGWADFGNRAGNSLYCVRDMQFRDFAAAGSRGEIISAELGDILASWSLVNPFPGIPHVDKKS